HIHRSGTVDRCRALGAAAVRRAVAPQGRQCRLPRLAGSRADEAPGVGSGVASGEVPAESAAAPGARHWPQSHRGGRGGPGPDRAECRHPPPAAEVLTPRHQGEQQLKLLVKFNLVFVLLFLLGIAASGYISWQLLQRNAEEEIAGNARLIMSLALAVRTYTNTQINPLLKTQMV